MVAVEAEAVAVVAARATTAVKRVTFPAIAGCRGVAVAAAICDKYLDVHELNSSYYFSQEVLKSSLDINAPSPL